MARIILKFYLGVFTNLTKTQFFLSQIVANVNKIKVRRDVYHCVIHDCFFKLRQNLLDEQVKPSIDGLGRGVGFKTMKDLQKSTSIKKYSKR